MSAAPTVMLKEDWDYQPRLGQSKGHHSSRHNEQEAIADFVGRRDEGSMLVVGRRGSGKTSLVIAAVNKAVRSMPRGKTVVPVSIKATSAESNGPIDKKQLLVSLIRSLQQEVPAGRRARHLRKEVDRLHENATATKKSRVRHNSQTLSASLNYGTIPSYALAILLSVFGGGWLGQYWWVPIALALAPVVVLASRWGIREELVVSSRHDYGFADIQREFERMLHGCSATHKIVFILDEFDKVGDGQSVADIMAPMKMLINQGGALYIFITSPDKTGGLESRLDANYTVFSETLFVKRSLFEEMESFVDNIVESRSDGLTDEQYADLRCYLCYAAKADFFDLHRVIRDRRAGIDGRGRPVLAALLSDKEKTAANLQRAIKYVYDRKAYGSLSRQQNNDDMLEVMYHLAEKSQDMLNQTIVISGHEVSIGDTKKNYTAHEASAARDLFMLLSSEGYLVNGGGDDFVVKGMLSQFQGGAHVEEERAFARAYDALLDAMVNTANCKSYMGGHGEPFDKSSAEERWDDLCGVAASLAVSVPNELRQCNQEIGTPEKPSIPPDTLRQSTDQALQAVSMLRTASVDLVAQAFESYLGIVTAADGEVPLDLASAAGLSDRAVYSAVANTPSTSSEIRLAIVDAQKPATSESFRSSMALIEDAVNEIVVLLAGDNIPESLKQSFFVIGSVESADQVTNDARVRAERYGSYGFAVRSPPTVRDLGLVLIAVEKTKARRTSRDMLDLEASWQELKSMASGQVRVTDQWFANRLNRAGAGA